MVWGPNGDMWAILGVRCTPREEKFGCYHGSKACLGDLKSDVVLSYQWQVFCK